MARIVITVGHPRAGSYCEALAESYQRGAVAAGHEVKLFRVGAMTFDLILHEELVRLQPLEPDLQVAHDAILAADHLVVVFPLWIGMVPTILKGFLERVLQPDVLKHPQGGFVKFLRGKSARIFVTMGMPAWLYWTWYGAYAVKTLKRCVMGPLGVRPIHATVFGGMGTAEEERRAKWLKRVEGMGRRAA